MSINIYARPDNYNERWYGFFASYYLHFDTIYSYYII